MGIVEGSCGYRARGVNIRGKFVLSRNVEYKTRWGRHVAKYSSDPRQAYPEVKPQGGCDPLCPNGGRYPGKFVLSSGRGEMGPGDVCLLPLEAVRHRRARQTSESGPVGDCRRVLWVPGPRGQYSGKIRFIDKS